jgi:hypothetical protein
MNFGRVPFRSAHEVGGHRGCTDRTRRILPGRRQRNELNQRIFTHHFRHRQHCRAPPPRAQGGVPEGVGAGALTDGAPAEPPARSTPAFQTGKAPDGHTDMREPANKSLLTDVSRLCSYRCTIIVSTNSLVFVEGTGCGAQSTRRRSGRVQQFSSLSAAPSGWYPLSRAQSCAASGDVRLSRCSEVRQIALKGRQVGGRLNKVGQRCRFSEWTCRPMRVLNKLER